ncbi:MAG: DUF3000 domain-containing protein [Nocardiopsaceae bacterium]|jgi:hypothetical protein|nr:DUF3000 domain-containing protein [Nocardiopsaceae bacterium]
MRQVGQAAGLQEAEAAAFFQAAAADLAMGRDQAIALRRELSFEDIPAPRRLAPHAAALAVAVRPGQQDLPAGPAADADPEPAAGRFVLLYDPAGQPGWGGPLRVVVYIRADLDPEIATDPLLGQVGWSWLIEALDARTAGYEAISGTVTRVVTEGFGGKAGEQPLTGFELRASWSPVIPEPPARAEAAAGPGLAGHVAAWCETLCAASGLPPLAAGVAAFPPPAARRRA